jgi:hypothetical protein
MLTVHHDHNALILFLVHCCRMDIAHLSIQ